MFGVSQNVDASGVSLLAYSVCFGVPRSPLARTTPPSPQCAKATGKEAGHYLPSCVAERTQHGNPSRHEPKTLKLKLNEPMEG